MIILGEKDYEKAITILENNEKKTVPTFTYSVLNNYISGIVYADSKNPETILIGTQSGIYFVAGKEDNQKFNNFLLELYSQRKSEELRFTLFSSNEHWDCVINELFKDNLKKMNRYYFIHDKKKSYEKSLFTNEYSMRRISEEQIACSSAYNEDYYNEYWGSVANFTAKGFGYCMLHKGQVISECTSIFASLQFSEIDIETHENYRGQGLGLIVAKAFINDCLEKDIMPRWDCDISNASSIRLAEKLGFSNPSEYSIFLKKSSEFTPRQS
ncbi:GNAT family N-acetyltransferase [Lysinibacillus sphaericus]|uniref:GNAT family N-acetyltransferase n=1 Tax=Lysinibacillus sphaericus TaxID=1421 RepID=UPI003D054B4E